MFREKSKRNAMGLHAASRKRCAEVVQGCRTEQRAAWMRGCLQLAVDPSGDGFVGGLALATLSGATGAEIWRTPIAGAYPCQVALDRAGDLLATFSSPSGSLES